MLSEQSAATVRATLPAVGAAIGTISERFYERLFAAHPELLRDLFNRGNQAAGTQRQALAGSIAAFATHLVQRPDDRPDVMLRRIAHKHASLGIAPAQYRIVHEHLFAAIAEVLGEAVTPEVGAAWDEVYWLMANALIAIEKELYEDRPGGGWREWVVVERVEETAEVTTFRLRPADGDQVSGYRPGQYVSVQVTLPDGARQIRQYSLSAAPGASVWQISVKRVHSGAAMDAVHAADGIHSGASADGVHTPNRIHGGTVSDAVHAADGIHSGASADAVHTPHGVHSPDGEVSNHLHAHVHTGDTLRLSAAYGDLVLDLGDSGANHSGANDSGANDDGANDSGAGDPPAPLLLASAGIGVTPMIAMLQQLAADGFRGPVTVVHADRSPADHGLRADHEAFTAKLPDGRAHFWYEEGATEGSRSGLVDLTGLDVPAGTRAYLCGPLPFMRTVRTQLLAQGVPAADIHYEVFGPDLWLAGN